MTTTSTDKRFTDSRLRALVNKSPEGAQIKIPDTIGLTLRVGQKWHTWYFQYRVRGAGQPGVRKVAKAAKPQRMSLGTFPGVGLALARKKAAELIMQAQNGIDPKAEARAAYEGEYKRQRQTFTALWPEFYAYCDKVKGNIPRVLKDRTRRWEVDILPALGERSVYDVTRVDLKDLVTPLPGERGRKAGNDLTTFAHWLFDERGYQDLQLRIFEKLSKSNYVSRERVLEDKELIVLWNTASNTFKFPFRSYLKMLILTGQRRGEVANMRWDEISEDGTLWTIPAERMKNRKTHEVPLSTAAQEVLEDARAAAQGKPNPGGYVFTSNGNNPVSAFGQYKKRIELGGNHWTWHDIRRTVSSGMAALGTEHRHIAKVLSHSGRGSVTDTYNRHPYLEEKREALERWGRHVLGLVAGPDAGNVVPLRQAG